MNGYDGYKAGIVTGSLASAEQALSSAFTVALSLLDYEHPLAVAIREALEKVTEARRLESAVARDAMTGYLRQ